MYVYDNERAFPHTNRLDGLLRGVGRGGIQNLLRGEASAYSPCRDVEAQGHEHDGEKDVAHRIHSWNRCLGAHRRGRGRRQSRERVVPNSGTQLGYLYKYM